jgi:hypothetical protein
MRERDPGRRRKNCSPFASVFRPRYPLQSSSFSLCGKEGVELSAQGCLNCERDFSKLSNRGDNGWDVADCLLPVLLSTAPDGFFYFFVFDLDPCSLALLPRSRNVPFSFAQPTRHALGPLSSLPALSEAKRIKVHSPLLLLQLQLLRRKTVPPPSISAP